MGHLNGILARVGRNLNNNFQKSQIPGGGGGMLKIRFDRYINGLKLFFNCVTVKTLYKEGVPLRSKMMY